jgi:hypothetical protein
VNLGGIPPPARQTIQRLNPSAEWAGGYKYLFMSRKPGTTINPLCGDGIVIYPSKPLQSP